MTGDMKGLRDTAGRDARGTVPGEASVGGARSTGSGGPGHGSRAVHTFVVGAFLGHGTLAAGLWSTSLAPFALSKSDAKFSKR